MFHVAQLGHPISFLSHLFHFGSPDPASDRDSTPVSAVDSKATGSLTTKTRFTVPRTGPQHVDERVAHEPPFVDEMMMDLP